MSVCIITILANNSSTSTNITNIYLTLATTIGDSTPATIYPLPLLIKKNGEQNQPEPGTKLVSKARLIVTLKERPGILLERFPRHVDNILRAVSRMKTESEVGISLSEFRENAGRVLRAPGGGIS